jgi:hypothetical protein
MSSGSTYKSYSKPVEPTHRAAPMTASDALRQLYGDESGDEGSDVEMGDDQVNDFNDFELLEGLAEPSADTVPLTDPDTGGSDMDAEPADTQDGSGQREESEKGDDSEGGSSHSPNTDDEDKLDRKRQRILARVLPAVMIKRSAQQEMSVMSTSPSTCTDQCDCFIGRRNYRGNANGVIWKELEEKLRGLVIAILMSRLVP